MYEQRDSNRVDHSTILQLPMQALIKVPPTAVNALHPSFTPKESLQLLSAKYRNVTYQDALVTGNASWNQVTGDIVFNTKRPEASFKGMVFEAYLARMCRDYSFSIGRRVFAWCTGRQLGRVTEALEIKSIVVVRHVSPSAARNAACSRR